MSLTRRRLRAGLLIVAAALAALLHGPDPAGWEPAAQAGGRTILEGIDVSHWNGTVNWTSVRNAGKVFAFCKATEGTTFIDSEFAHNWAGMAQNGIVRGAYHFGRPGTDAVAQAQFFVSVVQPTSGDLQLVLDLEVTDGRPPAEVWAWTRRFIKTIYALTGRPGIIYTGYYFWRDSVGNPSDNLNCPLWIAAWNTSSPPVPNAWSTWSFWQYSSTGHVAGVNGNCDLDRFNGTTDQLLRLTLP